MAAMRRDPIEADVHRPDSDVVASRSTPGYGISLDLWTPLDLARNIVNQLFDEAEVSVEKRQEINDRCDDFVADLLRRTGRWPS